MAIPLEAVLLYDATPVSGERDRGKQPVRDLPERALVAQARTGDFAAFEELVRRYRNDVFRLSYHFVRNREDAWDLSQEVFIKAHRSLSRFRGEAQFKTWLLRITANQCKDALKKRRLRTVAFDERLQSEATSGAIGPDRALQAKETGEAINEAIQGLSHKHRTAFVLREFEGLSYEEMAQAMECSLGTVMSRLHHARKKLRKRLIQLGVAEGSTDA
ncbi:MAG: sigma-70 family RNA polymerase sigma factor [Nitrospiraceae bacterium]|nr:sigma-70 family RNA polymerase sigma factor [Nitrospiraceae bacterium]